MSRCVDHKFNHASSSNSVPFHCVSAWIPRCSISYMFIFFSFCFTVVSLYLQAAALFACTFYVSFHFVPLRFLLHLHTFLFHFICFSALHAFLLFLFFFHFIFLFTSFHLISVPFPFVPLYALTIHNDILCPANTHTQF